MWRQSPLLEHSTILPSRPDIGDFYNQYIVDTTERTVYICVRLHYAHIRVTYILNIIMSFFMNILPIQIVLQFFTVVAYCKFGSRLSWLQVTWQLQMTTVTIKGVPLRVIMNIDYVWSTVFSTIFQLYLCGHVYCWRKLEFSEKSTICILFVTRTRGSSCFTKQTLYLYCDPSLYIC